MTITEMKMLYSCLKKPKTVGWLCKRFMIEEFEMQTILQNQLADYISIDMSGNNLVEAPCKLTTEGSLIAQDYRDRVFQRTVPLLVSIASLLVAKATFVMKILEVL